MGRKGVSKRKPRQTKIKPLSNDNASNSVTSVMNEAKSLPAKSFDNRESAPSKNRKK
jgi:hypothetical protein